MNCTFVEYFKRVKEQLECNASEAYKSEYIVYTYSNEQVDEHLVYFRKCKDKGLSAYKSLLFFGDYMDGDYDI